MYVSDGLADVAIAPQNSCISLYSCHQWSEASIFEGLISVLLG